MLITMSDCTDWVEFSPYEIGMAKYGTFMTPDLFGSKFFMGTAIKKYEENPIHFLMGDKDDFISCRSQPFRILASHSKSMSLLLQVCGAALSPFCSTESWESKIPLAAAPWKRN